MPAKNRQGNVNTIQLGMGGETHPEIKVRG
jgi:hypothetical protein